MFYLGPLIRLLACLEVQAALHRIPGYSRGHSRGQGLQTRPVAPQEASGWSLEPSPCRLLPESLEDPAEGWKESHRLFVFETVAAVVKTDTVQRGRMF